MTTEEMSDASRASHQGHVLDDEGRVLDNEGRVLDDEGRVLAEVRRALGRSATVRPEPLEPFVETSAEGGAGEAGEELIARFTFEASAVGAHVHRANSVEELAGAVARVCADADVKEVALSGAEIFAESDLNARLAAHGLSSFAASDFDTDEHDEFVARLEGCGAGLTAVDYAIAETGTVALGSDEEGALLVSLLPTIHVAVLRASQIVGSLGAAIGKLKAERMARDEPCRSATFITGPSRTSDVELVLSIGVHGPKELHLIILGE